MYERLITLQKNQTVLMTNKEIKFISYTSHVASIKDNKLILHERWDYSQTTKKWLKEFIFVFTGNRYNTKELETIYNSQGSK